MLINCAFAMPLEHYQFMNQRFTFRLRKVAIGWQFVNSRLEKKIYEYGCHSNTCSCTFSHERRNVKICKAFVQIRYFASAKKLYILLYS